MSAQEWRVSWRRITWRPGRFSTQTFTYENRARALYNRLRDTDERLEWATLSTRQTAHWHTLETTRPTTEPIPRDLDPRTREGLGIAAESRPERPEPPAEPDPADVIYHLPAESGFQDRPRIVWRD